MAVAIAVLSTAAFAAGPATGREISGLRDFSGEVVVPKGETWTVLPGARIRFSGGRFLVRGTLVVEGTERQAATIEGDDAFEGVDLRGAPGSRFSRAVLSGGRRGVLLTNASAQFHDVVFERNAVGIDVGQYAKANVVRCVFRGNGRVGLLVKRGGGAEVTGARFVGAGKAGLYSYGAEDVTIRDSRFEKNAVGVLVGMAGARALVSKTAFRENGTGIVAEKTAAPVVESCEVTGNGTGLSFRRRAEGAVSGCRIDENGTGVLVEYSSYPVFRGNTFRKNREAAVRLRHQSSEWEGEATEADREDAGARAAPFGGADAARGEFRPGKDGGPDVSRPGPPGKRAGLTGTVDFRGNGWGELQPQVDRGGPVAGIHDGRVEPFFVDRGRKYRMDTLLLK